METIAITSPLNDGISAVSLLAVSGNDLSITNAARVSHGKEKNTFDESDKKLLTYLWINRHTSPFEHTYLKFHIVIPIYLARQWMRHRHMSYNEISGRYTEMQERFRTPEPRKQARINKQASEPWVYEGADNDELARAAFDAKMQERESIYKTAYESAYASYKKLLELGEAREQARAVLPLSLYTEFICSCNMLAFLHFSSLRYDPHAQWEIQLYAKAMIGMVNVYFPETISIWSRHESKILERESPLQF
jgi:thymidylate synthase (FAD)